MKLRQFPFTFSPDDLIFVLISLRLGRIPWSCRRAASAGGSDLVGMVTEGTAGRCAVMASCFHSVLFPRVRDLNESVGVFFPIIVIFVEPYVLILSFQLAELSSYWLEGSCFLANQRSRYFLGGFHPPGSASPKFTWKSAELSMN